MEHNTINVLTSTITLDMAVKYTKAWRSANKQTYVDGLNGFFITEEDISQLNTLIPPQGGCRAYFGVDETTQSIKLLLVPVDAAYKDITSIEHSAQVPIFDFTTPCPRQCDPTSPLITGVITEK